MQEPNEGSGQFDATEEVGRHDPHKDIYQESRATG
jgi:hypothetical protein